MSSKQLVVTNGDEGLNEERREEMENSHIKPFEPAPAETAAGRWERWLARFDNYLVANNVTNDARKRAQLLHHAGEEVFDINLALPTEGGETYEQLKEKLNNYFAPKRNIEYEVYVFRQASQSFEETLDKFYTRLRQLAKNCEFHNAEREIKSQVIQKCLNIKVREKGLNEPEISLKDLLQFGRSLEATSAQAEAMTSHNDIKREDVNRVGIKASTGKRRQFKPRDKSHTQKCFRCGGKWPHESREKCPAFGKECAKCHKKNHFARCCKTKQEGSHFVGTSEIAGDTVQQDDDMPLYQTTDSRNGKKPYTCTLLVNGLSVTFEIDTGASSTLVSESQLEHIKKGQGKVQLTYSDLPQLRTYTGAIFKPLARTTLNVRSADFNKDMNMLIVSGDGPNLLGRDWLSEIKLDWHEIFSIKETTIKEQFPDLFKPDLGCLKDTTVSLAVDTSVKPVFHKARPVPFSMQDKVEKEIDRLVASSVLKQVTYSDWASPIVPVLKQNNEVRICGDYKSTVNRAVKIDKYPIPNVQDLYVKLAGSRFYSKLDLSYAYQQLPLCEESQKLTTINTSKGLFAYTRLPFGIAAAPGIFQRAMEQVLQGIPHTCVYLDDILVAGRTATEHNENLKQV